MKNTTVGTYGIIALGAVILGIIIFSRSAAVEAVYPMERSAGFLRREFWPRVKGVFNGPSKAAENERLRREVASLSMMLLELERLESENAALRRSLGYSARMGEEWLAAPVLSDHAGAFGGGHVIRVGRGAREGVRVGAVVASPDGLVGQVYEVTDHTCAVGLITDPQMKIAGRIELKSARRASGIIEGGDREKLMITHINGLAVDAPQARVVTSGRGGVFPEGLVIGVLIHAEGEQGRWSGTVRPGVDFDELEDVFIRRER